MMAVSFDTPTLERFTTEEVIWLVTVRTDGQPQASPVWSIWDEEEGFLLYSQPDTGKLRNIKANPAVCLHLDGGVEPGSTTIIEGNARRSDDVTADLRDDFIAKYGQAIARGGWTPSSFSADYSVPIRVDPIRLRSW